MTLAARHCTPCTGATPRLEGAALAALLEELPAWQVTGGHLCREFQLASFQAAIDFVVAMAAVAEAEQHHPDFSVHYDRVHVELWTHAIDGLSENDCVLAAKLDRLGPQRTGSSARDERNEKRRRPDSNR